MLVANRQYIMSSIRGALLALALVGVSREAAAGPAPKPVVPAPKPGVPAPKPGAKPAPGKPGAKPAPPKDNDAPVISCEPPMSVEPGQVNLDFTVTDQSALFGVLFHWRQAGEANYRQIDFPSTQNAFKATFNAQKDFEFYIEAYDEVGNGPALFGSSDAPKRVTAKAPEPVETIEAIVPQDTKPEAPPPEPPPVVTGAAGPMRNTQVNRVFTGKAMPMRMFELRVTGEFAYGSNFLYPTATVAGQSMKLSAAYQALDFLAVGLSTSFGRASLSSAAPNPTGSWPLTATSGTDLGLFARITSGPLGAARLGLVASLDAPAAASSIKGSERALSAGLMGLASIDTPQFRLHLNAGYKWDNSENTLGGRWSNFNTFALGLSRYDDLHLGLAVELPVNSLVPYAEWTIDVPVDRRQFSTCDGISATATCPPNPSLFPAASWQIPQRAGIGARYEISPLIALDLAVEFSLTRAGTGYDDATAGSLVPLAGLPPPAPFAGRLNFAYQFGTESVPEVAEVVVPSAPSAPPPDDGANLIP